MMDLMRDLYSMTRCLSSALRPAAARNADMPLVALWGVQFICSVKLSCLETWYTHLAYSTYVIN